MNKKQELAKIEKSEPLGSRNLKPARVHDSSEVQIAKSVERKEAFIKRKKEVIALEEKNESKIIFFRQKNGYWHLGGYSAQVYVYIMAKRYNRRAKFIEDTFRECRFPDGEVVAVKELTMLSIIALMISDGATTERKDEEAGIIIIELNEKITRDSIDIIKQAERETLRRLREEIMPKTTLPRTMDRVEMVVTKISSMLNKTQIKSKMILYEKMFIVADELLLEIIEVAKSELKIETVRERIEEKIKQLENRITSLIVSHKIEPNDGAKLVKMHFELRNAFNEDIRREEEFEKIRESKLVNARRSTK